MNDAPERIELIRASGMVSDYWRSNYSGSGEKDGVEYIRSDLFDEQAKENKKLWADLMYLRRRLVSAALKP